MKALHLIVKKAWFDMIRSGEKEEEYREPSDYILPRLLELEEPFFLPAYSIRSKTISEAFCYSVGYKKTRERALEFLFSRWAKWRSYDIVIFQHGYSKNAPRVTVRFRGAEYCEGNPNWGAVQGRKYFVIKLGERL